MPRKKCHYRTCRNKDKVTFFHFPVKDEGRCKQWIINSGNSLDEPIANYYWKVICQNHFADEDFINALKQRLVHGAVPVPYDVNEKNSVVTIRQDLFNKDLLKNKTTILKWIDELLESRHNEDTTPGAILSYYENKCKQIAAQDTVQSTSKRSGKCQQYKGTKPKKQETSNSVEEIDVKDNDLKYCNGLPIQPVCIKRKPRKRRKKLCVIKNYVRTSESEKFIFYMKQSQAKILKLKAQLSKCRKLLRMRQKIEPVQ